MTALLYAVAIMHCLLQRLGAALDVPPAPSPRVVVCAPLRASGIATVAPPPLATLKVAQLRTLARSQGHKQAGGRPVGSARKADLLGVLA